MAGKEYRLTILMAGKDTGAKSMLGGVGSALGSLGSIAGGILGANLFMGIARQVGDMARQALEATASWERMGMAMTSMTARELRNADATLSMKDAMALAGDKAKDLMSWIEKLAINSPFDAESIATSFRQALTYGFTADEAQKLTQVLVNMSAGAGLSADKMGLISYALGQIHQSDKLLMLDLRQLMNAGVPVNDILKTMGYTLSDVGKEAISTSDFLDAFNKTMGEDFAGAAKLQASSWAGLTNSISDIKKIGLREFFSSTFSTIQPYVDKFVQKFTDPAFQESLRKWGEPLGKLAGKLMKFFESLNSGDFDLSNFALKSSEAFKNWSKNIDWAGMSDELIAGLENIDWAGAGVKIEDFASDIFSGIGVAVTKIKWGEIASSLTIGLSETLASAVTGNEVTFESSLAGYVAFGDGLKAAVDGWTAKTEEGLFNWIMSTRTKILEWQADVSTNIFNAISGIIPFIATAISLWKAPLNATLQSLAIVFYTRAAAWVQQAINAILSAGPKLLQSIIDLLAQVRGVVKPVSFTISLPNFEKLAEEALAGWRMVQAAMNGHGSKGGKSTGGGGGGSGTGGSGSGNVPQMANGGIVSGPLAGFRAILHGTEAVIPLKNGSVPVSLNAAGMGGGMTLNFSFVYAPTVSTADRHEAADMIAPLVIDRIRQEFTKRNL